MLLRDDMTLSTVTKSETTAIANLYGGGRVYRERCEETVTGTTVRAPSHRLCDGNAAIDGTLSA